MSVLLPFGLPKRKNATRKHFDHLALLYDTWCFSTLVELSSLGKRLRGHGPLCGESEKPEVQLPKRRTSGLSVNGKGPY